jgi:hypothetical protein
MLILKLFYLFFWKPSQLDLGSRPYFPVPPHLRESTSAAKDEGSTYTPILGTTEQVLYDSKISPLMKTQL